MWEHGGSAVRSVQCEQPRPGTESSGLAFKGALTLLFGASGKALSCLVLGEGRRFLVRISRPSQHLAGSFLVLRRSQTAAKRLKSRQSGALKEHVPLGRDKSLGRRRGRCWERPRARTALPAVVVAAPRPSRAIPVGPS